MSIPVRRHGGLLGSNILRFPHSPENRLKVGGKIVGFTRRPPLYLPEIFFIFACGTHFCQKLSKPQGLVRPERSGKLIKIICLIGF
jgi:hypothetical protein